MKKLMVILMTVVLSSNVHQSYAGSLINLVNEQVLFLKIDSSFYFKGDTYGLINQDNNLVAPFRDGDAVYIPVSVLSDFMGIDVKHQENMDGDEIWYETETVRFIPDQSYCIKDNQQIELPFPVKRVEDILFAPTQLLEIMDVSSQIMEEGQLILYRGTVTPVVLHMLMSLAEHNSERPIGFWNIDYSQEELTLAISPMDDIKGLTSDYYAIIQKMDLFSDEIENILLWPTEQTMIFAEQDNKRTFHVIDDLGLQRGQMYLVSVAKPGLLNTVIMDTYEMYIPAPSRPQVSEDAPPYFGNGVIYPISGVDQGYEADTGLDIGAPIGTPVYAVADAYIRYSEYGHTPWKNPGDTAYSVSIKFVTPIPYEDKMLTGAFYTHLSSLVYNAAPNDGSNIFVKQGDIIGYSGIANKSPHLHFEFDQLRGMSAHRKFFDSFYGKKW